MEELNTYHFIFLSLNGTASSFCKNLLDFVLVVWLKVYSLIFQIMWCVPPPQLFMLLGFRMVFSFKTYFRFSPAIISWVRTLHLKKKKKKSNNKRLVITKGYGVRPGDNDLRSNAFVPTQWVLCVGFSWQKVKTRVIRLRGVETCVIKLRSAHSIHSKWKSKQMLAT